MREILDFAKGLDAERDAMTQLVFELPIVLKLQAVYRPMIPDLADKKGVQSRPVATLCVAREGAEEDFVRRVLYRRIKSTKRKREAVSLRFDELILPTNLEFLELQIVANGLLEEPLYD